MDKIILDTGQINKLLSWRDKHKELVRQYKTIITDGIIEVTDTKKSMFFKVDGNYIDFNVPFGFTARIEYIESGYRILSSSIEDTALVTDTLALYFAVTAYIYYFKPEIKTRQYSHRESIKQTKNSKQNYIKTVTVKGIIYTIGKINVNRKPPQRYIDAWSVRGHARHLQSGKVVYVRPHVKGKGRVTDKTYKIKP